MAPQNKNNRTPQRKNGLSLYWMYGLIALALIGVYYFQDSSQTKEVNFSPTFENAAMDGEFEKIVVFQDNGTAEGILTKEGAKKQGFKIDPNIEAIYKVKTNIPSSDKISDKIDAWNTELASKGKPQIEVTYDKGSDILKIFWYFGPILLFIFFMWYMSKRMGGAQGGGGGIFSVGKSKAKVFDKNNGTNVTFKDVAGLAEAKVEIEEIVEFLKNPQRYTDLGAKIPKGALLVGPPGTGKTLLAKAVAGEANVPFLSLSGSDFVEMFVGVGAARVRDLFKQAKDKAPCIVFIDEIDAVGRARGKNANLGGNDERENTLNQMLTEMDGFGSNNGVIVLAATNRADMLDKALLRPGRFDRQIYVDLPELTDRIEIFNVHLRNIKVNADLDIEKLARQTQGFSGADIANVCNEAALIAARHNKPYVEFQDFLDAVDRIIGGLEKKSMIITDEEKVSIATHEAGHAVVGWLTKYGNPLVKVTIVPRGRALGAAWYAPEERQIMPKAAFEDMICGLLAGRAAEEVFLGEIGGGASNDLERVTKIARAMVILYGMSDKLPNVNFIDSTGQDYGFQRPYSEETAQLIDSEVNTIIARQYERAKEILRAHAEQHNKIRDLLVEHEVIMGDDVEAVLGPRQWKSRTDVVMEISKKEDKIKKITHKPEEKKEDQKSGGLFSKIGFGKSEKERKKDVEIRPGDNGMGLPPEKKNEKTDDDDPGTPPPFTKGEEK